MLTAAAAEGTKKLTDATINTAAEGIKGMTQKTCLEKGGTWNDKDETCVIQTGSKSIASNNPNAQETTKIKIKQGKSAKVRSIPSSKGNIPIAILKGGVEVEKVEEKGPWQKIIFITEGWIHNSQTE